MFLLGLLMLFLVFPATFASGRPLIGYLMGFGLVLLGAYLVRRGGLTSLVLGLVLISLTAVVLSLTVATHLRILTLASNQPAQPVYVSTRVDEDVTLGPWLIRVEGFKESRYLRSRGLYYEAPNGYKVVVVRVSVKNLGPAPLLLSEVWGFKLITEGGGEYGEAYERSLRMLVSWRVTSSVVKDAVAHEDLASKLSLEPGGSTTGSKMFLIPASEKPRALEFKVGLREAFNVMVKLV